MTERDHTAEAQEASAAIEDPDDVQIGQETHGSIKILGGILGTLLTLGTIVEATELDRMAGFNWFTEQKLVGMFGIALTCVYVVFPFKRGTKRLSVPWYDWIAVIIAFCTSAYVAYYYEPIFENLTDRPTDAIICSVLLTALLAEGLRRAAGNILFGFLVFFIAFGLIGHLIPGDFQGRNVDVDRMFIYIALDSNGLVGIPLLVSTTVVIAFILFSQVLSASKGTGFFTDISAALMGRYRGGSSKIAVTASSLFGSISGSAVANVASTGAITIPLMRQGGYPAHAAGAIEAVASTGGQLMPPMMGAAAFVMAEFLELAYKEIVLAALIPAALYYIALFIQADLFAARDNISRVPEDQIPKKWPVIIGGWQYLVPFVLIVVCLFDFNMRPQTAALWATLVLVPAGLFLGYNGKKMTIKEGLNTLPRTGIVCCQIMMIGAMAGMIIGVLNITGLGFALTIALVKLAGGILFLILLLGAIVCIILGMGMPTLGVYLLVATLVTPAMVEVGVPPLSAHFFALYFGMLSMITPPVAIAAFTAATVAGSDPMKTGFSACAFGWSAYVVPFLFVLSPELLMQGEPLSVALAFVTAVAGVYLVSTAVIGYITRHLNPFFRLLFAACGLALLLPATAIPFGIWSDIVGAGLGALLIARELIAGRTKSVTSAAE